MKAQQRCLSNVVVQASCAIDQKSIGGVFIKAFVSFQNSGGKKRPSPAQLHSRSPLVYVPWSAGIEPVIYKGTRGSAAATVPYIHLLSAPDGLLCPKFPLSKHESWNLVQPCSACPLCPVLKQRTNMGLNAHLLQFACMDQLLSASEDRVDSIIASLPLTDDRKRGLLPDIAKWRRDPMSAIAFMSSVAAANAAAPSRYTVTAHTTMVRIAVN